VTDYRLPAGWTGVDVVESIRQSYYRTIPAIIITEDAQAHVTLEAARAGCEIIHKPRSQSLLFAAITRALSPSPMR
jgi:hypothetical protein